MDSVRPATVGDADALARIRVETRQHQYRGIIPDATLDALDVETTARRWERTLRSQDERSLAVYVLDDPASGVAGYLGIGPERGQLPGFRGEVYMLYVHPSAQGRGYGRALLRHGLTELARRGLIPVAVWVLHDNPARDFYAHMGAAYVTSQTIEIGTPLVEDAFGWVSETGQ